jgi:hypothetical protein
MTTMAGTMVFGLSLFKGIRTCPQLLSSASEDMGKWTAALPRRPAQLSGGPGR